MRTLFLLSVLGSLACASMTERIVHEALKGLVSDATYAPKAGGNPEALAALHHHLTTNLRINVQYLPAGDPELRNAFGVSYSAGDHLFIRLRQDLSVNGSIEVLAHEAAHLFPPPHLSRPQSDVFAEIVSAHVAAKLGVPQAATTSALWLRQHKASIRMALDLQNEIEYIADFLTPQAWR